MTRHTRLDATAMVVMTILCACWGFQQVAVKVANGGVSPVFQAGLRSAVATVLMTGWAVWRGLPLFRRDGTMLPGLIAGLLFAGEFALMYGGLTLTTASRSVVFMYTSPFVVAVGVHFFVPGERLRRRQVAGLACAFVGILAAFGDGLRLPTPGQLAGDLMILGAAVLWGATTVVIKASRLARASPTKTLLYQLATSAVTLPLLSLAMGEPGFVKVTGLVAASLAYQILVVACVSYLTWFWLVASYPAGRLTAFSFLTPLFGMLAGGLLLADPITPALVAALVLVAAGIYLVNTVPAQARPAVPPEAVPVAD